MTAKLTSLQGGSVPANIVPEVSEKGGEAFSDLVNKVQLTKKERLVAQHLLDNPSKAGFMTASGIARDLFISDVTVIRLARKLGYSGFAALQEALQQEIVEKLSQSEDRVIIPRNRLDQTLEKCSGKSLLQLAVDGLIENVGVLTEKNNDEIFERAAQIIYDSHRKVVVGFRGSTAAAESFSLRLSYLLNDVSSVLHADPSDYGCIFNLKKDDCLIVFGFEEYQKSLVLLVKQAQKNGVSVIAITDKETSPLAFRSSACIYCSIKGISFNSFSTVILSTEIISAYLVKMIGTEAETRNQEILDHMKKSGYYLDHHKLE